MEPKRGELIPVGKIIGVLGGPVKATNRAQGLDQDFHFDPGTATVYTHAARIPPSFRAEPCTSAPAAGPKARPSAHRR